MKPLDDFPAGSVFGRLTTLAQQERKGRDIYELCRCVCGVEKFVSRGNLRSGRVNSCGCLNSELVSNRCRGLKHEHPKLYAVWNAMRQRCSNLNDKGYANYGGRGINYAVEWNSFATFLADMGDAPAGLSLERVDNEKGYSKDNCVWATRTQQNNNTRRNKNYNKKGQHGLHTFREGAGSDAAHLQQTSEQRGDAV